MNSITIVEIFLVSIIIVAQTSFALKARSQIKFLAVIIPALKFFKLKKYNIPIEDLQEFEPKEILVNLAFYEKKPKQHQEPVYSENDDESSEFFSEVEEEDHEEQEYENKNDVSLINPNESTNEIFDEILLTINVYLLRNKGAATDFNLIKDVVERNLDMEEEDISHTVTIPLYLGLMGTMLGIVSGLINLYSLSGTNFNFDIKGFLGNVSIAMFASLWGLFCTVANSSFNLKNAKRSLERAKNGLYTFLQTELLPVLNQSVSSSIFTLHTNLVKFNDNFTINLNKLSGMLNKNHDALIAQERILQAIESIDINEFAKANIKVLKELKTGTEQLEKFSEYLNSLNFLASKTSRLSTSFEDLLNRVNNFESLAEKLDSRIEQSNQLVQFLGDHYSHFEFREDVLRELIKKLDDTMIKSLNDLEEHTQIKIEAIKQITVKEEDLMTQAFSENRSHISKLSLLGDLKKSLEEIKFSSAGQIGSIKEEIKSIKSSLEKSNSVLKEISNKTSLRNTPQITQSLKRFFGFKNKTNEE